MKKIIISFILISIVVVLCIFSILNKSVYTLKICNFVLGLGIIIFLICYLVKYFKLNNCLNYIEELERDKRILTNENDRIRIFKHDFNNIIQAMNGYVQTEDIPSLKSFVKKMIKDVNETEEANIGNKFLLNNKAITNLLNRKYDKAKNENININFEIMFELNLLKKYEYELIRILGIFLDNSIEAQREESDKMIEVLFLRDKDEKKIIIENTCTKETDINKIYTKEFSTKKGNTGLGLWEVKKIVESHPEFSLYTTFENNLFRHTLIIK